jgi:hypothetical protein
MAIGGRKGAAASRLAIALRIFRTVMLLWECVDRAGNKHSSTSQKVPPVHVNEHTRTLRFLLLPLRSNCFDQLAQTRQEADNTDTQEGTTSRSAGYKSPEIDELKMSERIDIAILPRRFGLSDGPQIRGKSIG